MIKKHFILPHILFWLVSVVFFTVLLIYTRGFRITEIDVRLAFNILITVFYLAISVYINLLWLIPHFFRKRKFVTFSILQIGNICLFILLNYVTSHAMEEESPVFIEEAIAEFILVSLFLIVATLLKFMRDSIALQDAEIRVKEIERQKIEAELKTLQAQINPHSFFNTLNSLYALSLDKSEKTPDMILKLSELMRYLIYESRGNLVPIARQLEFLQNYIYLEKMRLDDYVKVDFSVTGEYLDTKADPLIFIAFIENAFKHGTKTRSLDPFIHIRFHLGEPGKIEFLAENNTDSDKEEKKSPGLGLGHVKKRLDLLYPDKYKLQIESGGEIYRVSLILNVL